MFGVSAKCYKQGWMSLAKDHGNDYADLLLMRQ